MNKTINALDYKIFLICIKYIPIIMAAVVLVHTALIITVQYESVFAKTFGISILPALIVYSAQKAFRFCLIHKLLLWYCVFADFCLSLHNRTLLYSVLVIGIILSLTFVIHCIFNERITNFIEKTINANCGEYRQGQL